MKKGIFKKLIFTCVSFSLMFSLCSHILVRKTIYQPFNYTISLGNFSNVKKNSVDILALGSSHMYCSLDARLLKEETGKHAYILAAQQQPMEISYYFLKQALKTQHPETVVVELYMVNRDYLVTNEVLHDSLDNYPLNIDKLKMIKDLVVKEEQMNFVFPFFAYHSRWKELGKEDFSFSYLKETDEEFGYARIDAVYPQTLDNSMTQMTTIAIEESDRIYLEKIEELCEKENIRLVYLFAPEVFNQTDVDMVYSLENYAENKGIEFINGYELLNLFNPESDFCDSFGHLNESGAGKLTLWMKDVLLKNQ